MYKAEIFLIAHLRKFCDVSLTISDIELFFLNTYCISLAIDLSTCLTSSLLSTWLSFYNLNHGNYALVTNVILWLSDEWSVNLAVFWVVGLSSLVEDYQRFKDHCSHGPDDWGSKNLRNFGTGRYNPRLRTCVWPLGKLARITAEAWGASFCITTQNPWSHVFRECHKGDTRRRFAAVIWKPLRPRLGGGRRFIPFVGHCEQNCKHIKANSMAKGQLTCAHAPCCLDNGWLIHLTGSDLELLVE